MDGGDHAGIGDFEDAAAHARRLKKSARTLNRWANAPDGLPFAKCGGSRLFNVRWTLEWLEGRRVQRNPTRRGRGAA